MTVPMPDFRVSVMKLEWIVIAVLPICTINGHWGIFELARIRDHAHWDEDEMELLKEISNQIAIAIQQAELYQEAQRKQEELSRAYRELQDTQVQLVQAEKNVQFRTTRSWNCA